MPKGVFKTLMLKTLSEKTGLDTETLTGLIAPQEPPGATDNDPALLDYPEDYGAYPDYGNDYAEPASDEYFQAAPGPSPKAPQTKKIKMPPIYTLVALLANHPELVRLCADLDTLRKLDEEGLELLLPLVELLLENPGYSLNHILGYWRGMHSPGQAEQLAKIAATDLLRPVANSERDNEREFLDCQRRLLRQTLTLLEPVELLRQLADKEAVDEHDLKHLNNAWLKLPREMRSGEAKELFNQIVAKPRQH
jgi:hypothetical protein